MNCIECELQRLSISLHPPAPTEPLGEVIRHYMSTLCSAQKQSNLTNSLLQDISVCNRHDATQLEDWLGDIETVADLTAESRTKLFQTMSKGLPCTLMIEAITIIAPPQRESLSLHPLRTTHSASLHQQLWVSHHSVILFHLQPLPWMLHNLPFAQGYFIWNATVSELQFWIKYLNPHVLSHTID